MSAERNSEEDRPNSNDISHSKRQALSKGQAFSSMNYFLERAVDELNIGVILTDSNGLVGYCNQYAKTIAESKSGLIGAVGAPLKTTSEQDTAKLRAYIERAAAEAGKLEQRSSQFAMALGASEEAGSQYVAIVGLAPGEASGSLSEAGVVVFATRRGTAATVPESILRDLFGLTGSEASLTKHILECKGVATAAQKSDMGLSTARTHLKRVFAKTQTSRQAALVDLVLKSVGFVRF